MKLIEKLELSKSTEINQKTSSLKLLKKQKESPLKLIEECLIESNLNKIM
jgi:hypothetical protein